MTVTKCNGSLRTLLLLTSEWELLHRVSPVLKSGKERANKLICQILPLSKISGHSFLTKHCSPMVSILCYLFSFTFQSVLLEALQAYHGIHKGCTCKMKKTDSVKKFTLSINTLIPWLKPSYIGYQKTELLFPSSVIMISEIFFKEALLMSGRVGETSNLRNYRIYFQSPQDQRTCQRISTVGPRRGVCVCVCVCVKSWSWFILV